MKKFDLARRSEKVSWRNDAWVRSERVRSGSQPEEGGTQAEAAQLEPVGECVEGRGAQVEASALEPAGVGRGWWEVPGRGLMARAGAGGGDGDGERSH